jgi:hypothetical protein
MRIFVNIFYISLEWTNKLRIYLEREYQNNIKFKKLKEENDFRRLKYLAQACKSLSELLPFKALLVMI